MPDFVFSVLYCLKTTSIRAWNWCGQFVTKSYSIRDFLLNEDFTSDFKIKSKICLDLKRESTRLNWSLATSGFIGPIRWRFEWEVQCGGV